MLDTGSQSHICVDVQALTSRRDLAGDEADIRVADGKRVVATAVGTIRLSLPSGLLLVLNNIYCVPTFRKDIISLSVLDSEGFNFTISDGLLKLYRDSVCYVNALLVNGLYVLDTVGVCALVQIITLVIIFLLSNE